MTPANSFDALVIGGGPAGCATALALAPRFKVAVLARNNEVVRCGDMLPPSVAPTLHRLGVWDLFIAENYLASPGILSAWQDNQLRETSFVFDPYLRGWHIDRP